MAQSDYTATPLLKDLIRRDELANEYPYPDDMGVFTQLANDKFGNKTLWPEQQEALDYILRFLAWWYADYSDTLSENAWKRMRMERAEKLYEYYEELSQGKFHRYGAVDSVKDANSFKVMEGFYREDGENNFIDQSGHEYIRASARINRMCAWMATGSGKTLVMVKVIECLGLLMSSGRIPTMPIMLAAPGGHITEQARKTIAEFNKTSRSDGALAIKIVDFLGERNNVEQGRVQVVDGREIPVYITDPGNLKVGNKNTAKTTNIASIENHGNWYVFLDEAHHGENKSSLLKAVVDILSRNGMLFSFSATFADSIDKNTVIYDFSLPAFTEAGYGKNVLVMKDFQYDQWGRPIKLVEEETDKESLVIASLILQAALTKYHAEVDTHDDGTTYYHMPLHLVVCNSVNNTNTKSGKEEQSLIETDLKRFFRILSQFATGDISPEVYDDARNQLMHRVFLGQRGGGISYTFNKREPRLNPTYPYCNATGFYPRFGMISAAEVKEAIFGSKEDAPLQFVKTGADNEMAFQLATAAKPCGLIKIGDVNKFVDSVMAENENCVLNDETIYTQSFFDSIDQMDNIRILMGSRMFYEGWDAVRPSIESIVGIGKGDGEKFVPQLVGRGVRLCADPNDPMNRKRADAKAPWKNPFMETLFVFATDRQTLVKVINGVKGTAKEIKRSKTGILKRNESLPCPIIRPNWKKVAKGQAGWTEKKKKCQKVEISAECLANFLSYMKAVDARTLSLCCRSEITPAERQYILDNSTFDVSGIFRFENAKNYQNMDDLLVTVLSTIRAVGHELDKNQSLAIVGGDDIRSHESIAFQLTDEQEAMLDDEKVFENIAALEPGAFCPELDEMQRKIVMSMLQRGEIEYAETTAESFGKANGNSKKNNHYVANEEVYGIEAYANQHFYFFPIVSYIDHWDVFDKNSESFQILTKGALKEPSECAFFHQLIEVMSNKIYGGEIEDMSWAMSPLDEVNDQGIFIPYFSKKRAKWARWFPDFVFTFENEDKDGIIYDTYLVDPKGNNSGLDKTADKIEGYKTDLCDYDSNRDEWVPKIIEGDIDNEHYRCRFHIILTNPTSSGEDFWLSATKTLDTMFKDVDVYARSNTGSDVSNARDKMFRGKTTRSAEYRDYYAPTKTIKHPVKAGEFGYPAPGED